jgi:hypothetical protein
MIREHDYEPIRGLPGHLPEGERILWQGAPDAIALFRRAFRGQLVGVYFLVLMAWRAIAVLSSGGTPIEALSAASFLLVLGVITLALLGLFAWAAAHTSVYTITNRRVVMRVGIALSNTFNIPFTVIETAALRQHGDGTGDLPLVLTAPNRLGLFHIWPHARPWQITRPEPMLRGVPDALGVAEVLADAMKADALRRGVALPEQPGLTSDEKQTETGGYETKEQARKRGKFATVEA